MLLGDYLDIPIGVTLGSVALVLAVTIALSIAFPRRADGDKPDNRDEGLKL